MGCPGKCCGALHGGEVVSVVERYMGWGVLVSVVERYMGVRCPGKRCGALHRGGLSW